MFLLCIMCIVFQKLFIALLVITMRRSALVQGGESVAAPGGLDSERAQGRKACMSSKGMSTVLAESAHPSSAFICVGMGQSQQANQLSVFWTNG